jgi:FixJ family two-component response regulator
VYNLNSSSPGAYLEQFERPGLPEIGSSPLQAPIIISIIDDEEKVRRGISSLLRSLGYEPRTFASAEAFLESSTAVECSCIVSDVHMEGMSGIDLFQTLVSRGSKVPFIFVTAFSDEVARLKLGKDICVLPKPFQVDTLVDCIEKATLPTT